MKKYLILGVFCLNNACFAQDSRFFNALGQIESSNNPKAYNKHEKAIGIYQIRPLYFEDAKKFAPELNKYNHLDCFDVVISQKVVSAYMRHYEPKALRDNNLEILARCHNGGCNWRKYKKSTDIYWYKFQKIHK